MSWISGLADKAENILNKIDQNAATALQIPANDGMMGVGTIPNTLDSMRKSLSSSTLSLKATLSPSKGSQRKRVNAAKSEGGNSMTNSVESKDKIEWNLTGDMTSSRKTSISSKDESTTIDMEGGNITTAEALENAKKNYKTALLTASTSTTAPENQELAAFKIALSEVINERDELRLRLSSLNRDIENAGLKQRLHDLELLVQSLSEERDQIQHNWNETQIASVAYVHSISELETNLAKLQQEYVEVAQKLQMQTSEMAHNRQELINYRAKAQRALQMKDNLIAELKNGGVINDASDNASNKETDMRVLQIEFDALKQEHQQMLLENQNLLSQVQEARHDLNALTKQHAEKLSELRLNEEAMGKELRSERERALISESEQRLLTQELQNLRQQHSNQVAALTTRLQGREQQLEQMRAEKMGNKSNGVEQQLADYDTRISTLTQTLVDKQNAVERITAERNALRLQLEKVQDQLHQSTYNKSVNSNSTRNALLSNSTDDVKAQFPLLIRENPSTIVLRDVLNELAFVWYMVWILLALEWVLFSGDIL